MGSLLTVWRLFARRGLSNWPLLGVLGLGVLVASTLLAAAPIYSRAMSDLGLTFTIRDELAEAPATSVMLREIPLQTRDGIALRQAIETRIDQRLGWFRSTQYRYLNVGRFFLEKPGENPPAFPFLAMLQSFEGYESHVRVVEGRLPRKGAADGPMEVVLSAGAAALARVQAGDRFSLVENFDTCERELPREDPPPPPVPCTPKAVASYRLEFLLVGTVEPIDRNERFWPGGAGAYFDPFRLVPDAGPVIPMVTDQATVFETFGARFPAYRPSTVWQVFPDPGRLTRMNFRRARDDLDAMAEDVRPLNGFALSPLKSTLESFEKTARHRETPLVILLLEIAGVALFYVLLMAVIVVERQAAEIGLLRGRGATTIQVVFVYLFDGLIVGIPSLLAAPLLAAAGTALLGLTPSFEDVNGGHLLPVTISPASFGLAGAGAGLAMATLAVPVFIVARRGGIGQRQVEARPGQSFIQRYYLDLALAAVAGLLLWELHERGSVFTPDSSVGLSSDPLLLASPALIIAAGAALIVRFVPLLLRIVAALTSVIAGVAVAVGLWQVVRNPGQYTRLALLLMMAVAVGTFAASYASTTERSYRDRAKFEAGVEWRASSTSDRAMGPDGLASDAELAKLEGVERVSAAIRTSGSPATPGQSSLRVQVLGLDPAAAREMVWTRGDFADRPIPELLRLLGEPGELGGRGLPGDPTALALWVNTADARADVNVWARVRDGRRNYGLVELGTLDGTGWRQLRGSIRGQYSPALEGPFTLVSILLTEPPNRPSLARSPIYIDDIVAIDQAGRETVIDDFEAAFRWGALPGRYDPADTFVATTDQKHGGRQSGKYTINVSTGSGTRGVYIIGQNTPAAALASQSFLESTGLPVGGTIGLLVGDVVVPVTVRAAYRLFPTLPAARGPSIVVNRDHLESWLLLSASYAVPDFNEAWFELAGGADREALARAVEGPRFNLGVTFDQQQALASIERDPLIAAGGGGILLLSFVVLLVLVAAALLVSLWVAVRRRRSEFAVLRAMGLSRTQVLGQLACEYAVVAVVGLGAGAYLGVLVGRRMLSFLNVTEDGSRVEPSFILQTNWGTVLAGGGVVLLSFAAALLFAVAFLSRTSDASALRRE